MVCTSQITIQAVVSLYRALLGVLFMFHGRSNATKGLCRFIRQSYCAVAFAARTLPSDGVTVNRRITFHELG